MKSFLPNDELLSAYLDGEVTDQEREVVERALHESPEVRRALDELRRLQADVRALPRMRLEPDFCDRVLRESQRTMLLGEASGAQESNVIASPVRADESGWRDDWQPELTGRRVERPRFQRLQRVAAALAVLVPALVLMVLATRDPRAGVSQVATSERGDAQRGKEGEADEFSERRDEPESLAADGLTRFRSADQQSQLDRKSGPAGSLAGTPVGEGEDVNRRRTSARDGEGAGGRET